MRESMGGTWLFGIVALFIVLFSGFLAYSISYTKAFNTKNKIINLIEQNEGFKMSINIYNKDVESLTQAELENNANKVGGKFAVDAEIYRLIKKQGYNSSDVVCDAGSHLMPGGYCIKRVSVTNDDRSAYYKVTTYIKIKIPVINVTFKLGVSGETDVIYYDYNKDYKAIIDLLK